MKPQTPLWSTLLRWPLWLVSPMTSAHDFRNNPVLGSRLLNRLGLHVLRMVLAHGLTWLRWLLLSPLLDRQQRARFHRDGYLLLPGFLSGPELEALQAEARAAKGEFRECIQGDTLTHRLLLDETALAALPVTRRLLHDPAFTRPLRYAAARNAMPLYYIQSIRNGVRDAPPDPQKNLHSDTFHPTMKAWFFLEDVAPGQGAFTYVPGSQRLSFARLRWEYRRSVLAAGLHDGYSEKGSFRFEDADLRELGLPPPQEFAVPANTLVIANTAGIHCRGSAAPGSHRLEIWVYSRLNPFNPLPGLNSRWYARCFSALLQLKWRHLDRDAARRGELSSWHPISAEQFHGGPGLR